MNKNTEQKVNIKLFYDGVRYTDDVTVTVNGKSYIIKRGIEVSVPKSVKYALESAQLQERVAQKYIDTVHKA